ncbi:Xenobiotic-transporting ATPase [Syntrophobotulus glycolicus DSM 8271]|uniref:Xenobiotic-transporting ATPase n=1 Tax=Syntrophobotulus glycolicus (strain DSM 8271 / FlGlyR) TaxID=645991 RepID=F0SWW1_SYNGF|nr:ABC transporter ATP-binding protein [Syntrophobotulus glycolicus]ADY54651.1 Xenobiotic-transporting ATPase [Syntrophobotulus glycolicus DSM 8271]
MKKQARKRRGIARIIELSGEGDNKIVLCGILTSIGGLLQLFPFLSVYLVLAELLGHITDFSQLNRGYMIGWAISGVAGLVIGYVFMYAGGMAGHIAAYRIICGTRLKLAEHIGRLPMGYFNTNTIGKTKQILETELDHIERFVAHQIPDLINTVATLLVMFIIMFIMNVWLALMGLLPIILGFACEASMLVGKKAKPAIKERVDAAEEINASSIEYVRGMPSIKIFGQTVRSFQNFYNVILKFRDAAVHMAMMIRPGYVQFQTLIMSIGTFIIPVGLFLLTKNPDNISYAVTLTFFLVFAPGVTSPVFKLLNFVEEMTILSENVNRIDSILAYEPLKEQERGSKPSAYDIVFGDVSFSYSGPTEDGESVENTLSHISFTAPANQITALVGPSGSGKSTIAQLIPRFWDVQVGKITIGGVNIRDMEMDDLMNTLSFVFQDSFLFSDTLYHNIAMGKPGAAKDEVYAAAKAAQCDEFIRALPNGYDTLVGAGGVYLSGGEQQRVSVARAILKNAPILILDEATAYADPENEYEMQLALRELIAGKTVLVIAHRLATIQNADQILMIADGQVRERGKHQELLSQGGLYKRMWDTYTGSGTWRISRTSKEALA